MVSQSFKEFLDSKVGRKFLTLNNFYRNRLYLRTLAEYFYGDKTYEVGTCIFTKDGDFLRSTPTDTDVFWSRHNTVLFEPKQTVVFFDSEEAVSIYKQMTETLESPHYHLSKAEIIEIIEKDLDSQIENIKQVIEGYQDQIKLHQNRVDYLDQMKIDLRKAATLEDQVSRIEDLLDAANEKLVDTKFKFAVAEVIDKDLILEHDGGDVYNIHFVYDDKKTVLSKMSDDREKIENWMRDVLDRLDFYTSIVDQFESKLVDLNDHELSVCLHVNEDLTSDVHYRKNQQLIETIVTQPIDSRAARLDDHSRLKIYYADTVYFTYHRHSRLEELEEVLKDIDDSYRQHIVR